MRMTGRGTQMGHQAPRSGRQGTLLKDGPTWVYAGRPGDTIAVARKPAEKTA